MTCRVLLAASERHVDHVLGPDQHTPEAIPDGAAIDLEAGEHAAGDARHRVRAAAARGGDAVVVGAPAHRVAVGVLAVPLGDLLAEPARGRIDRAHEIALLVEDLDLHRNGRALEGVGQGLARAVEGEAAARGLDRLAEQRRRPRHVGGAGAGRADELRSAPR